MWCHSKQYSSLICLYHRHTYMYSHFVRWVKDSCDHNIVVLQDTTARECHVWDTVNENIIWKKKDVESKKPRRVVCDYRVYFDMSSWSLTISKWSFVQKEGVEYKYMVWGHAASSCRSVTHGNDLLPSICLKCVHSDYTLVPRDTLTLKPNTMLLPPDVSTGTSCATSWLILLIKSSFFRW